MTQKSNHRKYAFIALGVMFCAALAVVLCQSVRQPSTYAPLPVLRAVYFPERVALVDITNHGAHLLAVGDPVPGADWRVEAVHGASLTLSLRDASTGEVERRVLLLAGEVLDEPPPTDGKALGYEF